MDNVKLLKLIKKISECKDLEDLKSAIKETNEFIIDNKIKSSSDEYKKLEERIKLIHFRLKKSKKLKTENKTYVVSEEQLKRLTKILSEVDSTSQDIIDRILDQVSQHGEESLSPSQKKKLEDFSSGKSLEYDKPKYRDRPGVTFESEEEPIITFTFREGIETEEGFEYLGEVEFMNNVYTGFVIADHDDNLSAIEFENLETEKDLLEESEDNSHVVNFFEGVVKGLSDEDNPY